MAGMKLPRRSLLAGLALTALAVPLGAKVWRRYFRPDPPGPYDRNADAAADLKNALAQARHEHKQVLVLFGANWCPDCQKLSVDLAQPALASAVQARFVVTKVDVGHFDRNHALVAQFGNPTDKGIPAAVVVDPDGEPRGTLLGHKLASAHHRGSDSLVQAFDAAASTPR